MRPVSQQTERGLSDLVDGAGETGDFRKSEAIDRAISADAGNPAKQRVARDLSRNKTGIELEDDLMPGDFSKVIRVRELSIEHAQFFRSQSDSGDQACSFASIEIEDRNLFSGLLAQPAGEEQRAKMISRGNVPLTRSDEDPRTLVNWPRKIPTPIIDGIRGRDESDPILIASNRSIKIRRFGRRCDAPIRAAYNPQKTRESRRIGHRRLRWGGYVNDPGIAGSAPARLAHLG